MKKLLFLIIAAIAGNIGIANAQIEKGNLMLGTDLGSGIAGTASSSLFGANFNLNKGSGFNIGIAPKIGYFVADNLLIGGVVDLGYNKSASTTTIVNDIAVTNSTKTTTYGIQALARYYLNPGQYGIDNLLKHGRFFFEGNVGFAGKNVSGGNSTNGLAFGFGPGYSYFVTPNVALEALAKYNGLSGSGSTSYQSSIGINFGVQIFLSSSRVRSIIKNPSQL